MKRSKTDFNSDLFALMEAWSPQDTDHVPERVVKLPITQSIYDKYDYLSVDRKADEGAMFVLNKATASMLVKTIARVFIDIRQTMADPNADRSEAAYNLVDPFIWLHGVLSSRYVEALMTETSLQFALVPICWQGMAWHLSSMTQLTCFL